MKRKIFLYLLFCTNFFILLFMILASVTTYRYYYNENINVNNVAVSFGTEKLNMLSDNMKQTFFNIEVDTQVKRALANINRNQYDYTDEAIIKNALLSDLNKNNIARSYLVYFPDSNKTYEVDYTGISLTDNRIYEGFANPTSKNNYFEVQSDNVYAVHNVQKFETKALIAKIIMNVNTSILQEITDSFTFFGNEDVFIVNDNKNMIYSNRHNTNIDQAYDYLEKIGLENANGKDFENNLIFNTGNNHKTLYILKIVPKIEIIKKVSPIIILGIIIGTLCIICSFFLAYLLANFISKPILKLANYVTTIHTAGPNTNITAKNYDEIQVLEQNIMDLLSRNTELLTREFDAKIQIKQAQLKALQAQINPHFLYNSLQLIGSMALADEPTNTYRVISALSDIMRYNMDFETELVLLQEEILYLENYLLLQKTRFRDRYIIDFIIDEEANTCKIPKLILQPIIENCFKHAFENKVGDWRIMVSANVCDDKLHIAIEDNGVGISPSRIAEINKKLNGNMIYLMSSRQSIGLVNVSSRIKLSSSEECGIFISSECGQRTKVEVVLDVVR